MGACTHRRVGACADPGIGACADSEVTRLTLAYDGGAFAGWARQPGLRTVQEVLESAIERILREPLALSVAGRTDRGVHAWGQVASYRHEALDPRSLNGLLPADVAVLASEPAPAGFDARHSASEPDLLLPRARGPGPLALRGGPRAVGALASRPRRAARVRRAAPRHAHLHGVHADRDRSHALRASRPRGAMGGARRAARVLDRGGRVHAPDEPRAGRDDARGRARAPAASRSSRRSCAGLRARRRGRRSRPTGSISRACPSSRSGGCREYPGGCAQHPRDQRRRHRGRRPARAAPRAARDRRGPRRRHRPRRQPLGDGALDHDAAAAVGDAGRPRRRRGRATPPTARRSTACGSRTWGSSRASRRISSCRGSTTARTSATTSPTRGRWRRRSRGWCSGSPRSRSPSSRARASSTGAPTAPTTSRSRRRSSRAWSCCSRARRCRRRRC